MDALASRALPTGRCVALATRCNGCAHREGTRRCSRCGVATYCDRRCQARHWPDHRRPCDPARRRRQPPNYYDLRQRRPAPPDAAAAACPPCPPAAVLETE